MILLRHYCDSAATLLRHCCETAVILHRCNTAVIPQRVVFELHLKAAHVRLYKNLTKTQRMISNTARTLARRNIMQKRRRTNTRTVYNPRVKLCSQLSALRKQVQLYAKNCLIDDRIVKRHKREIDQLQCKLSNRVQQLEAKRRKIATAKVKNDKTLARITVVEDQLSQLKRMDIKSEWHGPAYNLFEYMILYHMKQFDGHAALLNMFQVNKQLTGLLQQQFRYKVTCSQENARVHRQQSAQQTLDETTACAAMATRTLQPLASVLQKGDVVSVLRQNCDGIRRSFDTRETLAINACPDLKAWSQRKIMLHRVATKTSDYLDLVPDCELCADTVAACKQHRLHDYCNWYHQNRNVFVRIYRSGRNKLWLLKQYNLRVTE